MAHFSCKYEYIDICSTTTFGEKTGPINENKWTVEAVFNIFFAKHTANWRILNIKNANICIKKSPPPELSAVANNA